MNTRKDFEQYITEWFGPVKQTASFEERIGPPEELPAIIGLIAMKFSELDEILSNTIIKMLQTEEDIGHIITAELSFKIKVHIFSSLFNKLKSKYFFNTFPGFQDEYFQALITALNKCEDFRNQSMHSVFIKDYKTQQILRKKTTAKQKQGLKKLIEKTDIVQLFNIADYIGGVDCQLEQFGINIMTKK